MLQLGTRLDGHVLQVARSNGGVEAPPSCRLSPASALRCSAPFCHRCHTGRAPLWQSVTAGQETFLSLFATLPHHLRKKFYSRARGRRTYYPPAIEGFRRISVAVWQSATFIGLYLGFHAATTVPDRCGTVRHVWQRSAPRTEARWRSW